MSSLALSRSLALAAVAAVGLLVAPAGQAGERSCSAPKPAHGREARCGHDHDGVRGSVAFGGIHRDLGWQVRFGNLFGRQDCGGPPPDRGWRRWEDQRDRCRDHAWRNDCADCVARSRAWRDRERCGRDDRDWRDCDRRDGRDWRDRGRRDAHDHDRCHREDRGRGCDRDDRARHRDDDRSSCDRDRNSSTSRR